MIPACPAFAPGERRGRQVSAPVRAVDRSVSHQGRDSSADSVSTGHQAVRGRMLARSNSTSAALSRARSALQALALDGLVTHRARTAAPSSLPTRIEAREVFEARSC